MTVSPRTARIHGGRRALLGAAIVGSLGLASCGSGGDEGADTGSASASPDSSEAAAAAPPGTPAPISAVPASTAPIDTAPPAATTVVGPVDAPTFDFSLVGPIVEATIDEHDLEGASLVVVQRDEGIVHEQYWGEFDPDRVSLIASSSKMLVAGVLLRLSDEGLIDLDAPVAEVVEWGVGNPTITAAQLVSNSSGLVGLTPNPGYPPYLCQFLPSGTLQDCAASIFTTAADDGDVIPPDTEYRYGGAQWQVAGAVAEVVSGRSWAELIDETYVEPCGVDSLAFNNHWALSPDFGYPAEFAADTSLLAETDNPNLEGGAYVTAPDYASLLLMLLRDGRCGAAEVLSPAAVDRMLADRIGEVYDGSAGDAGYGMGWFVDRSTGRRTDPGAYGSVAWLDVAAGHGAFLVIEGGGRIGNALAADLFDPVAEAIAEGLAAAE